MIAKGAVNAINANERTNVIRLKFLRFFLAWSDEFEAKSKWCARSKLVMIRRANGTIEYKYVNG